jgi:hypothetical protein
MVKKIFIEVPANYNLKYVNADDSLPTPCGIPDIDKMPKSKSPRRVFFVSLASSDKDSNREKIFHIIANLFQCSRVAVSSIPRSFGGFPILTC